MSGALSKQSQDAEPASGFPASWIPLFRRVVMVLIIAHVLIFLVALPFDYQTRVNDVHTYGEVESVRDAALTPELFAGYNTGLLAVTGLIFCALGILIYLRRPDGFMPLFISLVLVLEGTQISGLFYSLETLHSAGRWFAEVTDLISTTILVMFFLMFPNGRFIPAWTRWFVVAMVLFGAVSIGMAIASPEVEPLQDLAIPTLLFLGSIFGVMIYSQIHRYRWTLTPPERQQVKWVVVGMIAALIVLSIAILATTIHPERGPVAIMFWFTLANLGILMIPLTVTVAILRYRLFDIDTLINRALVYSGVSVILAMSYMLSVIVLQWLFGAIAGSSGLAVAISTLLAVAMFRPVRERVQRAIDHRFYRTRYDAAALLEQFSRSVRDEVELLRLEALLAATIDDAVRPQQFSFWMADHSDTRRSTIARKDASL